MATITAVRGIAAPDPKYGESALFLWETLTESNLDGSAVGFAEYQDRSVCVQGTFGGTSVAIQGSFDGGTTWHSLPDTQGTTIAITAAGVVAIGPVAPLIRPLLTGGTAVDVDVYVLGVRHRK